MTQEKLDYTTYLPEEKIYEVFRHLDEKSQSSLALTKKMFGHSIFQQDRIKTKLSEYIETDNLKMVVELLRIRPDLGSLTDHYLNSKQVELFKLAGFAEQDKMKIILESNPEFLYTYAPLKDISNIYPIINKENCEGITVFQHGVWTGNVRYMCNMILDCLPKIKNGEKIRVELERQYKELMDYGVVYELDGKRCVEKQFSLQSLLDGLSQYVTNYQGWTSEERKLHWCKDVGLPQSLLPAHFRHHYCDPETSFWYSSGCTKTKLIRSLTFHNYVEDERQLWDDSLAGLGSNFAITSSDRWDSAFSSARDQTPVMAAEKDLLALAAICEVRTKNDLPALIKRLQSPVQSPEEDRERLCVLP